MGNICSRSANQPDNFSRPGRPLNSAGPASAPPRQPANRAARPATKQKPFVASPGRTLGGESSDGTDPRANAAIAAQKRAEAAGAANRGKLGSKLAAQKAQTHSQTLNEASRDERAARDADNAAAAQRWE